MSIVYIDTETSGLDPRVHSVWEVAYAFEKGRIFHGVIPNSVVTVDPKAAEVNGYEDRAYTGENLAQLQWNERWFFEALAGNTICAANPAFDTSFLFARWGVAPWKYRLLDVEAYAMGALGHDVPQSLFKIADQLTELGHTIPVPDHTAGDDVATLRACHQALVGIYAKARSIEEKVQWVYDDLGLVRDPNIARGEE